MFQHGWSFSRRQSIDRTDSSEDLSATQFSGYMSGFRPLALQPWLGYSKQPIRSSIPRPSSAPHKRYRNINLLSIDYAFRPRLRIRLTLGGRTFPRNPWAYGDQDSHLVFRYSCLHGHSCTVHGRFPFRFHQYTTLSYRVYSIISNLARFAKTPYPVTQQTHNWTSLEEIYTRGFGSELESRSSSAQNHSTSELLRTL